MFNVSCILIFSAHVNSDHAMVAHAAKFVYIVQCTSVAMPVCFLVSSILELVEFHWWGQRLRVCVAIVTVNNAAISISPSSGRHRRTRDFSRAMRASQMRGNQGEWRSRAMRQKFVFSGREWQALASVEKLEWVFRIAVSLEDHNYGHGFLMYI